VVPGAVNVIAISAADRDLKVNASSALAGIVEIVLLAFAFPVVILLLGLPAALLIRGILEIAQRLIQ
jgi:hypothetical protein